jgi:hypothetical protein
VGDLPGQQGRAPRDRQHPLRRITVNKIPNVAPDALRFVIYLTDTDSSPHWDITANMQKAA